MAAQDLITLPEAKAFLNKVKAEDDAKISLLITRASDWIEQLTHRKFKERTFTGLRLTSPRSDKLYVPAWPINTAQAVTIKLDDVAQTIWKAEADGLIDNFDVIVASDDPWDDRWGARNHFFRRNSWESALSWGWPETTRGGFDRYRLLLSYTGGYGTVPEDLKQACLYLVQKLWRDQDKQLTGVASITAPTGGAVGWTPSEPTVPRETWMLIEPYRRLSTFAGA